MIQPQELRIGNYLYKTMFGIDLPAQVKGIDKGVVYFDEGDEEKFRDKVDMEFAKPIPLSEDWLIKFGFEDKSKEYGAFFKKDYPEGACKYNIRFDDSGSSMCIEVPELWIPAFAWNIRYVHQLQNLYFALTSQELTIKES